MTRRSAALPLVLGLSFCHVVLAQTTGTFTPTGSMVTARYGHTATLLADGRVLIAGGSDARGLSLSAELYDPSTGTFTATGSMAAGHFSATLLNNGKILMNSGKRSSAEVKPARRLNSRSSLSDSFPRSCRKVTGTPQP